MEVIKRLKYVMLCFLAIILVFSLVAFAGKRHSKRMLKNLNISFVNNYNPIISEETVNKLLIHNIGEVKNQHIETLDLNLSEEILLENPMIRTAEVSVTIDGKMTATIEPKNPVARIVGNPDKYLDSDNSFMPLSSEFSVLVPLVHGFNKAYQNELFELINAIHKDAFLNETITQITLNKQGKVALEMRGYDLVIKFGKIEHIEHKLVNFKTFLAKMEKDKLLDKVSSIDLRYNNQVVVKNK